MKSILFSTATAVALAFTAPAMAQPAKAVAGDYVQFSIGSGVAGETKFKIPGVGSVDADLNTGLFAAIAGGRSLPNGFAFEAEGIYLKNDIGSGDLSALVGAPVDASARTYGLMVNAHYAATAVGPFTAEVGAGVGYGQTKYKLLGGSDDADGLMWQLIAGLSYPVTDKFSWDLKYRYVRGPELKGDVFVGGTTYRYEVRTSTHVVAVGGRVKF